MPKPNSNSDDGQWNKSLVKSLKQGVQKYRDFIARALPFLSKVSDQDLLGCVQEGEYERWLLQSHQRSCCLTSPSSNSNHLPPEPPSLLVEVLWRSHMLRPMEYARINMQCSVCGETAMDSLEQTQPPPSSASLPPAWPPAAALPVASSSSPPPQQLISSVRKHQRFMHRMLQVQEQQQRAGVGAAGSLPVSHDDIGAYLRFLAGAAGMAARATDVGLEPSLRVDLVWHAHMQSPARYREDCLHTTGCLVKHDF